MSARKDLQRPLSAEEAKLLQELMQRAHLSEGVSNPGSASVAAMTDASKRRLEDSPNRDRRTRGYQEKVEDHDLPWQFCGSPATDVSDQPVSFGKTPKGVPIELPEGVVSLDMWGRTILEAGKHASDKHTYADMVGSADSELRGYARFCRGKVDSLTGQLHDFAMYVCAVEFSPTQLPCIPGTNLPRKYR